MKYKKKPVVIEAIIWNGNNLEEVMKFIGSEFRYDPDSHYRTIKFSYDKYKKELFINTLEGLMQASIGDYIIKGVKGEFYPCKPDIFEETYEVVGE
jgi:hypothetical protein